MMLNGKPWYPIGDGITPPQVLDPSFARLAVSESALLSVLDYDQLFNLGLTDD